MRLLQFSGESHYIVHSGHMLCPSYFASNSLAKLCNMKIIFLHSHRLSSGSRSCNMHFLQHTTRYVDDINIVGHLYVTGLTILIRLWQENARQDGQLCKSDLVNNKCTWMSKWSKVCSKTKNDVLLLIYIGTIYTTV